MQRKEYGSWTCSLGTAIISEHLAGLNLARVGAHLLDAGGKRLDAAVESVERDGSEKVEAFHHVPAVDKGLYGVCGHELCAVEQGEAFFRFEADRLPAEFGEDFTAGVLAAFVHHLAFADERQEQVGERGEVARGAERAAVVDHGKDVVVVEIEDAAHGVDLHA